VNGRQRGGRKRAQNRGRESLSKTSDPCFVIGLADLAAAITLGVMSSPGPLNLITAEPDTGLMSTLPWLLIPGYLVPLLVTMHVVSFYRLWRDRTAGRGD
jgi:hypothetical protein